MFQTVAQRFIKHKSITAFSFRLTPLHKQKSPYRSVEGSLR